MSFDKIVFNYISPPTVPTPLSVVVPPTPTIAAETLLGPAYQNSKAGQLVQTLQNLKATAGYISDAVSSLLSGIGVNVSVATEPELSIALCRMYNSAQAIPAISLDMYKNMLQAKMDITRADLYLDPNSPLQVSPVQRADIQLTTNSFEKALAADGTYKSALGLILNQTAGDSLLFDNMTAGLLDYPVLRNNDSNGVDVGASVEAMINDVANRYTSTYAATYTMIASPGPFGLAIPPAVLILSEHSLNQLGQIFYLLHSLKAIFNNPIQGALAIGLNSVILPRLLSDLSNHLFIVDRFVQMACNPTGLLNAGIGRAMGQLPPPYGNILGVGLTPLLLSAEMSGQQKALQQQIRTKGTLPTIPSLAGLPEGMLHMAATLNYSIEQNKIHAQAIQVNTSKAMDRRLNETGNSIELMSHLKEMEDMMRVVESLMSTKSAGATVTPPSGTPSNLQVVGQVVGGLKSTTGTSYSVQGNNLVLTPATIPVPNAQVSAVLQKGGATIVGPNNLITLPIGA